MNGLVQTAGQMLRQYEYLADAVQGGDFSAVVYRGDADGGDENALNRRRLLAVMRMIRTELITEENVARLFCAETESAAHSAYGGYSSVLTALAALLWQFNGDGRYDALFEAAKHANADCEAGFSTARGYYHARTGEAYLQYLEGLTPAECVRYMYDDMGLTEGLEPLLDRIEREYAEDIDELSKICVLNAELGRKSHNAAYYRLRIAAAVREADEWDAASAHCDLAECLMDTDPETAFASFTAGLPYLYHDGDWYIYNLGRDYIALAAQFIVRMPQRRTALWAEWAPHIRKCCRSQHSAICKAAVKLMNDPASE